MAAKTPARIRRRAQRSTHRPGERPPRERRRTGKSRQAARAMLTLVHSVARVHAHTHNSRGHARARVSHARTSRTWARRRRARRGIHTLALTKKRTGRQAHSRTHVAHVDTKRAGTKRHAHSRREYTPMHSRRTRRAGTRGRAHSRGVRTLTHTRRARWHEGGGLEETCALTQSRRGAEGHTKRTRGTRGEEGRGCTHAAHGSVGRRSREGL